MKKFQKRMLLIAEKLGFTSKLKEANLSAEEQKTLFAEYEKEFGTTYSLDKEANEDDPDAQNFLSAEEQSELAMLLPAANNLTTQKSAKEALRNKVVEQAETIEKLSTEQEAGTEIETVKAEHDIKALNVTLGKVGHSKKFLFGVEDPFFSREKWWNEITVSRKDKDIEDLNPDETKEFKEAFSSYMSSFKSRVLQLNKTNQLSSLNYEKLIAGESHIDYSDLFGKAGEYIVRRQDAVIAYLRTLQGVGHLFPVVSNVQNKEIAPGAHFGELSQGYRRGFQYKGNVNFTAEVYKIDDVMFKYLFYDMFRLEKQYVGYMNKEGSNVIKWTFIEWIITHFGEILWNEQQRRRVVGVAVPEQNVIANPAMLAADGILRAIERVEEENKVLPFENLKVYDESTIIDYFETFWDSVEAIVPNMEDMVLYANAKHKRMYVRAYRAKYANDNDFTSPNNTALIDVSPDRILWVPNMPNNCFKAWITKPNNAENLEDKPNEMYVFFFERDWEDLRTLSRWKEGAGLQMAGVAYKTLAELKASKRVNQWVFTNFPVTDLQPDATLIPASHNNIFLTGENTAAVAITDIANGSIETVYKIICGSLTNASTIAQIGKFAKITAAWTPAAIGDYIKVYAELEDYQDVVDGQTVTLTRPSGNWLELERKVS